MADDIDGAIATVEHNGNGRGHHPAPADALDEGEYRVIAGRGVRRRERALESGRQTGSAQTRGFDLASLDYAKRPMGREKSTLDALKAIRDLDPQASNAIFIWQRLLNPGNTIVAVVYTPDGEQDEGGDAQRYLDELARRVGSEYGSGLDGLLGVLALEAVTYGALAAEVAPDDDLRDVEDWYAIEPTLLAWKRTRDDRGRLVQQLGQKDRAGRFQALNMEQVFYIPVDPDVGDPYGRPPFLAAIGTAVAKASLLNDLRAYAHQFGYPRIHVRVLYERINEGAPAAFKVPGKEKERAAWARSQLQAIVDDYTNLYTDDTYVHYDTVEPAYLTGANGTFDFDKLGAILERQATQALKTLPILLGINEGTTETHGTVQWQIQVAGVRSIQRLMKRMIERLADVSLALAGFQAHARLDFDSIRDLDVLYEAQARLILYNALKVAQDQGWISGDEAAMEIAGHLADGDPVPNAMGGAFTPVGEMTDSAKLAWRLAHATDAAERRAIIDDAGPMRSTARRIVLRAADLVREAVAKGAQRAADDAQEKRVKRYQRKARDIFDGYQQDVADALDNEGLLERKARAAVRRDTAGDIADRAFGRGYARDMKRLLRDAIEEGMNLAGVDDAEAPEKLVNRIWRSNARFVTKLKGDLAEAIRSGDLKSIDDVAAWFADNSYRSDLMGRFLGKQGLTSGFVRGTAQQRPGSTFEWTLGAVATEHCADCLDRDGQRYTADDLDEIGYPGGDGTECMANCHCYLAEIDDAGDEAGNSGEGEDA